VARQRPAKVSPAVIRDLETRILFQDDDILVLNKPSGLAVQGGSKTTTHIDAALPYLKFGATETPRLVHRLDRDTSGLLLLARNRAAAQALTRAIDLALAKRPAPTGGERMRAVSRDDPDGLRARTDYALVAPAGSKFSWLALRPLTGRTHQLRAHMAALGTPIVGDPKYKVENERTVFGGIIEKKLHLHARSVSFKHPLSGRGMLLQAPLTDHMLRIWSHFGFDPADAVDAFGDGLG
jgi:23S rRNA pseudouridine955/2504/2580 synthase